MIKYIIAIDPDVDKSGVARLDKQTRQLHCMALSFPELLDYIHAMASDPGGLVVIEAGWLNKAHWHLIASDTKAIAAAKGNHTGRNHEVGRKIAEMCNHWGVRHELCRPLKKIWKGAGRKITHQELAAFTGITNRTNQEQRDAALIAWHFAGFSIRK